MSLSEKYRLQFAARQQKRLRLCFVLAGGLHLGAIALWGMSPAFRHSRSPVIVLEPLQFVVMDSPVPSTRPMEKERGVRSQTNTQKGSANQQPESGAIGFGAREGDRASTPVLERPMKTNQENEVESGSEVETQQDKIWGDYVVVLKEKIDRQFEPQRTSGESSLRNVRVRFEVNRQGQLLQVELTQSSGSLAVDQAAVLAVRRAAPFSAFPRRAAEDQLRINFTFDGLD